ncbi:class I SAM-dependent methyltransferase [Agriterribacter sp.]|uniref:class I SAM-dependent methyltransferase n=1 Tax=Agriterribacter sp. TaxID=2821509 RepID=UPI002C877490|nr:class I SAM-dependent methyltransferase [Agriterribacter sp.]HRP58032.1 class I SAM-dependent methyltransferase [Agriterribacter sp.]
MSAKAEQNQKPAEPDNTAVRTALWRALHLLADAKPHILEDDIGLKLVAPPADWLQRPDMKFTKRLRASIVARSRFIEDLIIEQSQQGVQQYVILGAGLDTFAQRRPDIASQLQIYEIDRPATLTWKQQRLTELGLGVPGHLPAGKTGVHFVPMDLLDEEDKPMQEIADKGAREAGTPFVSFFTPDEIRDLAQEAGFKKIQTVSTKDMEQRYFAGRSDDLLPASGEIFLLATTQTISPTYTYKRT